MITRDKRTYHWVIPPAGITYPFDPNDAYNDPCNHDEDGDGAFDVDDCNPADGTVYPGAPEVPDDDIDQDCDGVDAVTSPPSNDDVTWLPMFVDLPKQL